MHFSSAFVIAALPFLAAATPVSEGVDARSPSVTIPLSKRSALRNQDGTVNTTMLRASVSRSVTKIAKGFATYEKNTGSPHPLASGMRVAPSNKRATGSDSLTDDSAELWYGTISVGTPATTYTVDFDTGSSDLFLPGADCDSSCEGHTTYDPSSSSTSEDVGQTFSLSYGDGSTVSGEQYTDTVSIAGLKATKQTLGAAQTYSSGFESSNFPADGLLGMAFESLSDYNANPLFQTLVSDGKVDDSVFAFKLSSSGASLYLGGTDDSLYSGDFTYVPVTQEAYWQVDLDGVSVDGTEAVGQISSIIDTGTTQIVGDSDNVAAVYAQITGASESDDGTYTIPCDFNTPITLSFGGTEFTVDPSTFNLGAADESGSTCVGGLAADSSLTDQFWIVGDVFLQNVYTAFDVGNSQVGFATLA